ncbi:MAG TPA: VOC family protein [Streptosporangiaceae bacterium]|jgi:predicted enzyme related to lactoylglutathione lyase|nr:VOC family protein [Streptosporangiaceae bacterium]
MDGTRRPHGYGPGRGELTLVVDCSDLGRAASFWCEVLGYVRDGEPNGPYQSLVPADGQGIEVLLQRVPERKSGKNRLHLDLRTRELEPEVARVVAVGATRQTAQPVTEGDWTWHILSDPDGNEFCVVRPSPEFWAR